MGPIAPSFLFFSSSFPHFNTDPDIFEEGNFVLGGTNKVVKEMRRMGEVREDEMDDRKRVERKGSSSGGGEGAKERQRKRR